jgi:uncharacterized protein (TIGR02284 family)
MVLLKPPVNFARRTAWLNAWNSRRLQRLKAHFPFLAQETPMHTSNDDAVKVLNSLIETTLDSANGYRDAAEHVDNPQYKTMFSERSSKRMEMARRLQEEVRSFGGEPKDEQSMIGKMHNKFVGLKDKMSGDSDKAVIDEVERGEDVIKKKYEMAMEDDDLPSEARSVVSEAYQSVKADHDQISQIKHSLH